MIAINNIFYFLVVFELIFFPLKELISAVVGLNLNIITIISYVVYILFAFSFFLNVIYQRGFFVNRRIVIYLLLMSYCFFVIVFNYNVVGYAVSDNNEVINAWQYHRLPFFKCILYFVIGYNAHLILTNDFFRIKYYFFFLCFGILFLADFSTLTISDSDSFNYLDASDRFILSAVFSLFFLDKKNHSIFFVFLFFCLFLLGSRSSLLLFSFSVILYYFLFGGLTRKKIFFISTLIFSFFFIFMFNEQIFVFFASIGVSERMLILISPSKLDGDLSFIGRNQYLIDGLTDILHHPILGNFSGQLYTGGDTGYRWGAFIHNIIEYWRQFGLIVFLFFLYLMVSIVFELIKNKESTSIEYKVFFIVSVYLILSQFLTKSYLYYPMFVAVGMISNEEFCRRLKNEY